VRRGGNLLILAQSFGNTLSSVHFGDKRGHRLPKEIGDFRDCHVLILDSVVQQCCDEDVLTPVSGLCNQTGDLDQMFEVRPPPPRPSASGSPGSDFPRTLSSRTDFSTSPFSPRLAINDSSSSMIVRLE
jgi:hypothetical protein